MDKETKIKTKIKEEIKTKTESESIGITKAKRTTLRLTDDELCLLRIYHQAVCEEFDGSGQNPPSFNTAIRHLLMLALDIQSERQKAGGSLCW
jgi:hypothetical protein